MTERSDGQKFKKKTKTNVLYRSLPPEVIQTLGLEDVNYESIKNCISKSLPNQHASSVDRVLQRGTLELNLQHRNSKTVLPRSRKTELSNKERRQLGLYRLPKNDIKYKDALKMNKIWENFMVKFLNLDSIKNKKWYDPKESNFWNGTSITLMKADYHGAYIKVIHSECPSMIGHEGIVMFDTKNTFSIVGKDNVTRIIPKLSSVFELTIKKYKFTIFGKHFCIRSAERSTKKIKQPFIPML